MSEEDTNPDNVSSNRCPDFNAWIDFLSGATDLDRIEKYHAHLESCPACCHVVTGLADSEVFRYSENLNSTGRELLDESAILRLQQQIPSPGSLPASFLHLIPPRDSVEPRDPLRGMGETFGRFRLIRRIGVGGFGTVYLAEDDALERRVALKVPQCGRDMSFSDRLRFVWEGRAAASLVHPNVVSILEAGEIDAIPYMTSEYCSGPRFSELIARESFGFDSAAYILRCLALAVQHAHSRGILHRDIKPGNILLSVDDENAVPVAGIACTPRLADFGMAKAIQGPNDGWSADSTKTGLFRGTPGYMAPEQFTGEADTRSDVFSLGVVFYEMIFGCRLFAGVTPGERLKQATSGEEIRVPRHLDRPVPPDLVTICLKCLCLNAESRYQSAAELAEDLERYQCGEPIRARPVSLTERSFRWARRNPYQVSLAAVLILIPIAMVLGLLVHNARLKVAMERAEESERQAREMLYAADIRQMFLAWEGADLQTFSQFHAKYENPDPGVDLRGIEWEFLDRLAGFRAGEREWRAHNESICCARFSPDGDVLATSSADGTIRIWDVATSRLVRELTGHHGDVNKLQFIRDERTLASAGDDGTVRFWDTGTGTLKRTIQTNNGRTFELCVDALTGDLLSAGDGPQICFWNVSDGTLQKTLDGRTVRALAAHPAAPLLAVATGVDEIPELLIRDSRTLSMTHRLDAEDVGAIGDVCFSHDGGRLAAATRVGIARIYNVVNGEVLFQVHDSLDALRVVRFSPDDSSLAAGSDDGTIRIWDMTGKLLKVLRGHTREICSLHFSPDGRTLVSGDTTGAVRLWNWAQRSQVACDVTVDSLGNATSAIACYCQGNCVLTSSRDGAFQILNPDGSRQRLTGPTQDPEQVCSLSVSKNEHRVAMGMHSGEVVVWKVAAGLPETTLSAHQGPVWCSEFLDNGRLLTAGEDGHGQLWDLSSQSVPPPQHLHEKPILALDIAPDRRHVVTASVDGTARLWTLPDLKFVREFNAHYDVVCDVEFSPDGHSIATCSHDRLVILFDVASGAVLSKFQGHTSRVMCLTFSSSGATILSGDLRGVLRFWNVGTGEPLGGINTGFDSIRQILVSDRAESLSIVQGKSAEHSGTLIRWDLVNAIAGSKAQTQHHAPD
ncbi:MAG: protein kinase [Planctomycetaceae bacterium]|nr:protein kinase [Planctomycetaceae bacterium]